jgi:hypothetical protein
MRRAFVMSSSGVAGEDNEVRALAEGDAAQLVELEDRRRRFCGRDD